MPVHDIVRRGRTTGPPGRSASSPAVRAAAVGAGFSLAALALAALVGLPRVASVADLAPLRALQARLSDSALSGVLVVCTWLAWAVAAAVALLAALVPSRRAPIESAVRGLPTGARRRNMFEPSVSQQGNPSDKRGDDTMAASLASDGQPAELGWQRDRRSAEARMSVEGSDGGAVAAGGRREEEVGGPEARVVTRPRRLRRVVPPAPAGETPEGTMASPAELAAAPVRPPAAIVRVPLDADGDATAALSALGSMALVGDDEQVHDAMCAMVVDVASGRLSPPADVVLVGFGEEMHGLDGVVVVADERDAVAVARRAAQAQRLTAVTASALPPPVRHHEAIVFFVGPRRDEAALGELIGLAAERLASFAAQDDPCPTDAPHAGERDPGPLAVVVAGTVPDARWRLTLGRPTLDEALVRQLGRPSAAEDGPEDVPLEGSGAPSNIEVGVMGPVSVCGASTPFERRPKLTELVVYLAMHPEGATTDAWATALWPDRRMPMSTLSNRLSETRLALGLAPDGFAHLRKRGGRYHLGPGVTTDWGRFVALAASADPGKWRSALSLVRGRPFEGLREAQWTLLEGVVPAMESAIVELACRLAEHLLALRDHDGTEWAARRAMLACPWDERLYRLVMRAADAAGNRAGVEAALRQLACVLELGEEPLSAVHPETAALYQSLTSRRAVL